MDQEFLRFPGGSNLEGVTEGDQYRWNETVGSLRYRPGRATSWGYEETGGLGIVEFFLLCQDLGMEPSKLFAARLSRPMLTVQFLLFGMATG